MDGGQAPSLIRPDQLALAINLTFRGSYSKTRPPLANHLYTFANDTTETNWTGIIQGWQFYDGESGQSGWVIARGGHLFFLNSDTWVLSDITPQLPILTTADFTVPALAATVNVSLNTTVGIAASQGVVINGGLYATGSPGSNPVPFVNAGGDTPGNVVPAGTAVFDFLTGNQIIAMFPFPSTFDFIFMFQAENYMIILGGQHKTVIWDGTKSRQAGVGEVPPGEIGAYGWGRIWISRSGGRTYEGGNLVYGKTNSRADILGWDENDYLNEGGSFAVPYNAGPITSMQFLATQDTSLGQGPLIIGTPNMVFSNQAPVDRTVWKNLRNPIQTIALLEYGPEGGRCFTNINGDIWYRSGDGARSFMVARRNFAQPGNVPMSREVSPILDFDDAALLGYASGVYFDNRFLMTVAPERTVYGVEHKGLVPINFDLVSNLGQKSPPAWEGLWTGLNIFQLSKARIKKKERAFAMANGCDGIEFWEILRNGIADQYTRNVDEVVYIQTSQIEQVYETRSEAYGDPEQLKSLHMGELYIDEISDNVTIAIKFRPDQYPAWVDWETVSFCASVSQCAPPTPGEFTCTVWKPRANSYFAAKVKLPQPPETCNTIAKQIVRLGNEFQFRLEVTGKCRIRIFKTTCTKVTEPTEGECPEEVECVVFENCGTDMFTYALCDHLVPVLPTMSTTTVLSSLTDNCDGQTEFTLTATVISDEGSPVGTVTFYDGVTSLGSAPLVNGVAELDVTLATGPHFFTAVYAGSDTFIGSTSAIESFYLLSTLNCEWLSRILDANGTRPADEIFTANDVFYAALVSAGVWSKIVVMNTYAPGNLIAAITPLKKGDGLDSWENAGSGQFQSADLTVNGLKGNGLDRYLKTGSGPIVAGLTRSSNHGCVYVHTDDRTSAQTEYGSATGPNACFRQYFHYNDNKTYFSNCITYDAGTILGTSDKPGFLLQSRTATNRFDAYFANSTNPHAAVYTNTTPLAGGDDVSGYEIYVHATDELFSAANISKKRISFVCWGAALTSSESLALYNAVQALRTAYGGGFV